MSYEEQLKTLSLSSMERKKLRGDGIALSGFLRRGSGKGGAELWDPVTGRVGMAQSYVRGDLDWTEGSISLPTGRSNTGTGFLESWLMPRACQCLRHLDNDLNIML